MSRKYQVNVATVEKAYDLLEANGYIRRCQGSGCHVLPLDNFEFFADGVVLDSFRLGSRRMGRSMILPPARRWQRRRRHGSLSRWPMCWRSSGRKCSCVIRRYAVHLRSRRHCGSIWLRAALFSARRCACGDCSAAGGRAGYGRRCAVIDQTPIDFYYTMTQVPVPVECLLERVQTSGVAGAGAGKQLHDRRG